MLGASAPIAQPNSTATAVRASRWAWRIGSASSPSPALIRNQASALRVRDGEDQVVAGHPAAALPGRIPAHRQPVTQPGQRPPPVTGLVAVPRHQGRADRRRRGCQRHHAHLLRTVVDALSVNGGAGFASADAYLSN